MHIEEKTVEEKSVKEAPVEEKLVEKAPVEGPITTRNKDEPSSMASRFNRNSRCQFRQMNVSVRRWDTERLQYPVFHSYLPTQVCEYLTI
ncbi:hypothetical protein Aduo_019261 [Ancylostoma duodenale]